MKGKALFGIILVMNIVMMIASAASAQVAIPALALNDIEQSLYGQVTPLEAGLLARIERIEKDLFGNPQTGSLISRVDNLKALATVGTGGSSLIMKLNCAEWMIFGRMTPGGPLVNRLQQIEREVYGSAQTGPVDTRIAGLVGLVWPSGNLETGKVSLPAGTQVRVKLMNEISSRTAKTGDLIKYAVLQNITIDSKVIIPAGAEGVGRVTGVRSAGSFGRDADVTVDFGTVYALDGTAIRMSSARPGEKPSTSELAAGASLLGLVALGPAGLLGGVLVRGEELIVSAGYEISLTTAEQVSVVGLSLTPSR